MPYPEKSAQFDRLQQIIKTLRSSNGCPWDRKQTPATMAKYLLEETQELAAALAEGDLDQIREETGDLFFILSLIIAMHAEKNLFSVSEVLAGICEKMIRRHPHVFSDSKTKGEDALRAQWELIKSREKTDKDNQAAS